MERLIHSNTIISKPRLKPPPFQPLFSHFHSSKLGISFASRTQFPRVNSISSKITNDPLNISSFNSTPVAKITEKLNLGSVDFSNGSGRKPELVNQVLDSICQLKKVVAAGTAILVLTLLVVSIQPLFVSPAFATLTAGTATATATTGARLFRSEILTSAWTGFFAGCLHTLSGPDHLAALAPLSIGRTRMESAAVGALWGCGHDAGQVIFGLLFLLLKDRLHIEVIRTWGTRVVGFTLLVIGAMGIKEATEVQVPTPCVVLENGECDVSDYEGLENPTSGKKKIGFATFATGIVHGLQPDALMMVLPALALPSRLAGAAFLGMFLVGTVVSMGSYTVFIGSCSEALKQRIPRITEKLTWASSLIAIALGFGIILSPFFGFSLY
ncbi:chloroplast protein FOR GROWTH AND FERTILITY 2-like [Apium graveolens]|uniref:chloroplast protein FOR GROWTH AND FERTILITY 2-like n=1 Tax=Apium graveolens TaxID=4045 RepID=UPI003D78C6EA